MPCAAPVTMTVEPARLIGLFMMDSSHGCMLCRLLHFRDELRRLRKMEAVVHGSRPLAGPELVIGRRHGNGSVDIDRRPGDVGRAFREEEDDGCGDLGFRAGSSQGCLLYTS